MPPITPPPPPGRSVAPSSSAHVWGAAICGSAVTLGVVFLAMVLWGRRPTAQPAAVPIADSIDFAGTGYGESARRTATEARRERSPEVKQEKEVELATAKPVPEASREIAEAGRQPQPASEPAARAETEQVPQDAVKPSQEQAVAYGSLHRLATHAVLSPPVADIDDASVNTAAIDLGEFPVAHLIDPKFALAVPRDEYQGKPFIARVTRPDHTKNEWFIEFLPPAVEGALEAGSNKPRQLAKLAVVNDRLFIALTDPPSNARPQALLRRCVLLVSATNPEDKGAYAEQGPPSTVDKPHEIRFVKPTTVGPLQVDPFASAVKMLEIPVPPGITSVATGAKLKLPIASCEVKAKFVGRPVERHFPAAPSIEPSTGVVEDRVSLTLLGPGVELDLETALALADATLTIKPSLHGPNANKFPSMDVIKEKFLKDPERNRDRVKKAWKEKVMKSEGMKSGAPNGMNAQKLVAWFGEPFAVEAKMGVAIPGHETIQESLDTFLKDQYQLAAEQLNRRRKAGEKNVPDRPREPNSFDDWRNKDLLGDVDPENWRRNFQDTVNRWWAWFVPQLDAAWNDVSGTTLKSLAEAAQADCRIEAITSLAYDDVGTEYRVPLVVCEESPQPAVPGDGLTGTSAFGLE